MDQKLILEFQIILKREQEFVGLRGGGSVEGFPPQTEVWRPKVSRVQAALNVCYVSPPGGAEETGPWRGQGEPSC